MRTFIIGLFLGLPLAASAAACFDQAAQRYNVPVTLLRAISTVESGGRVNAYNKNKNGSYDIGHMQINSAWLPTLAKYQITEEVLKDPCINTNIGAWILAQNISRFGFSLRAIGAYNAASENKRMIYAKKVIAQLKKTEIPRNQNLNHLANYAKNG